MKKKLLVAASLLIAFMVWTLLLGIADVQSVGPRDSEVGFATVNTWFHNLTGVHMTLYHITDWLGLVPVAFGFSFAILGLVQWIKRKKIWKVDYKLLALGVFYLVVLGAYLMFEKYVVNYRPVLINNYLEASYPSSTTLLVMTVMPTAAIYLRSRYKTVSVSIYVFTALMVLGRLLSGVHWLTDIIGAALLSGGLVLLYKAACSGRK